MPASLKEQFQKMAEKAGLPPEKITALTESLTDENMEAEFKRHFVPQSRYSRDLDDVRDKAVAKTREEFAEEAHRFYTNWYDAEGRQAAINQWCREHGIDPSAMGANPESTNGPSQVPRPTTAKSREEEELDRPLTMREFQERTRQQELITEQLWRAALRLSTDYMHRFKEPFPVDEFVKHVVETKLSPDAAYDHFISPRVKKIEEDARKAEINKAKTEAVQEFVSKHNLPIDTRPKESSPLFSSTPKSEKPDPEAGRNAFLQSLRGQPEESTILAGHK